MKLRALLVPALAMTLAGCNGATPPAPTSPPQPVRPVVSGTVFETIQGVARPVANENLGLYIQETEGLPPGLILRGSFQGLTTDHNGRFSAQVPRSRVFVSVWGKRQPCLASASVDRDTTIDVPVFPMGSAGTAPPSASPMITGFVYEATPNGRKPLRGAEASLDLGQDAYIASTETDDAGRFFFCRVNARVRMDVFANGYEPYQYAEFIPGIGDHYFEFEFRR